MKIPFNKPYITGNEIKYIRKAIATGYISGNGLFTKKCQDLFQNKFGIRKCFLTTSCTDALEMSALLLQIGPGDEVIVPSYTFVSTALAFVRQGAQIRFIDSRPDHPGLDEELLENAISEKTKAIVVTHYGGVACDMKKVMAVAEKHNIFVIEDAAQSIDSYYSDIPLGRIGHLGCYSFHETKNIQCGEGGMLAVNDEKFVKRAEIIWEKGTNRAEFFRGEASKYSWVDIGSSFLPSDITAAFLFAQLESIDDIQMLRRKIWQYYYDNFKALERNGKFKIPFIPTYASNNAHMFYLIFNTRIERDHVITSLRSKGIHSVFHYLSLHRSPYYKEQYSGIPLPYSDYYENCLLRIPLFTELGQRELNYIVSETGQILQAL